MSTDLDNTHVRLQEYLEKWFTAKMETVWAVLQERKDQLTLTASALSDRMHAANNLQHRLDATEKEMLPIARYEREHQALADKLELERKILVDKIEDLVKYKIEPLTTWQSTVQGRASLSNWISIAALIVSALALVAHYAKY